MNSESTTPVTGLRAGTSLLLDPEPESIMRRHAAVCYPQQAIGFIFGHRFGDQSNVTMALPIAVSPVENEPAKRGSKQPVISEENYHTALKFSNEYEVELLGLFRSHPDQDATPVGGDQQDAIAGFSNIILEVRNGRAKALRSWILDRERRFDEERIDSVITDLAARQRAYADAVS